MHPHMLYILMYLAVGLGSTVAFWFANEQLYFETNDRTYEHKALAYALAFFLWPLVWGILAHESFMDWRFRVEYADYTPAKEHGEL